MAHLTAGEASSPTFASTAEALASAATESSTTESSTLASTFATSTSSDVCGIVLALAIIPSDIIGQSVALVRVLAVGALVPVHEDVFTTIVLHNEAKAFLTVEELADASLAHGFEVLMCGMARKTMR